MDLLRLNFGQDFISNNSTFLFSFLVLLFSTLFLYLTQCRGNSRSKHLSAQSKSTILFLGPTGSGKTTLIHTLLYGTSPQTVSSLSENELCGYLVKDTKEISNFVTLVDLPGVAQWRRPTLLRASSSGAIILVIDVSNGIKGEAISSAADLMFDLLTSNSALYYNQPILVIANKATSSSSSSLDINNSETKLELQQTCSVLKKALEDELVRLNSSRGAVAIAGEDDKDKGVLGTSDDGGFNFDNQICCKSKVDWMILPNSTKLQVEGLKDWISNIIANK
jgi:signal recognition particle receptor subunit beta